MKVLLVHDYGTPTGGAELQILSLRKSLRARGHDVRLFSSTAKPVPGTMPSDVQADYQCFGSTTRLQVLTQAANISAYARLRSALREFRPDIVHVRMFLWQLSPLILPLLQNIPSLYQTATYKAICPKGNKMLPDGSSCHDRAGIACLRNGCLTPQSWTALMVQRNLWLRWRSVFNRIVALSENMKTRLVEAGISPVDVIHNGVPERPMRPAIDSPPTVAYAGRLVPEKGLDVLLQAFVSVVKTIPATRLWIAGTGPERERLAHLTSRLGLVSNVEFLGHLTRAELESRFDSAWVQAAPSLWDEPFGNVATESMMRGTAVVASATGGLAEIVSHGEAGFLVPPGDAGALAQAVTRLVSDRSLAEQMGRAGRARALSRFSESRCLDRFLELYRDLIEEGAAR